MLQLAITRRRQTGDDDGGQLLAAGDVQVAVAEVRHPEGQGVIVRHPLRQGPGHGHDILPQGHGVDGALPGGAGGAIEQLEAEFRAGAAGGQGRWAELQEALAQVKGGYGLADADVPSRIGASQLAQAGSRQADNFQGAKLPRRVRSIVLVREGEVGRPEGVDGRGGDDHLGIAADRVVVTALHRDGQVCHQGAAVVQFIAPVKGLQLEGFQLPIDAEQGLGGAAEAG